MAGLCSAYLLSLVKLLRNFLPRDTLFHHKNHHVIKEIGNLIFNLIGVGILSRDYNFSGLLTKLFQNLVNPLVKKIIGV